MNIIVYIVLVIAICYPEYFKTFGIWDQRPYAKNSIGVFIARGIAILILFLVIIYDISLILFHQLIFPSLLINKLIPQQAIEI